MSTQESCPICLEVISETNVVITRCNHKFHLTCILNHCQHSANARCPNCRGLLKGPEEAVAPPVAPARDDPSDPPRNLRNRRNLTISVLHDQSESHSGSPLIEIMEQTPDRSFIWRGPRESIDLQNLIINSNINNLSPNTRYIDNVINNHIDVNNIIANTFARPRISLTPRRRFDNNNREIPDPIEQHREEFGSILYNIFR